MAGLVGRKVKIWWDDTGKVLVKEGVMVEEGLVFCQVKTFRGIEAIPTDHIVRCEVLE